MMTRYASVAAPLRALVAAMRCQVLRWLASDSPSPLALSRAYMTDMLMGDFGGSQTQENVEFPGSTGSAEVRV